ncbi:WD40-repeat-containing domain protein [Gautieria morchelliformis]|nr:WD40-repeat-containing domain protein [Gautieria morchelliformis]
MLLQTAAAVPDEKPELKSGSGWIATFSKDIPTRRVDVNLAHALVHSDNIYCVRFSADGENLASGCPGLAQVYDTTTGATTCLLYHSTYVNRARVPIINGACFSPDGRLLATAASNIIMVWDIANKRVLYIFQGHQLDIWFLDFSPDGRLIVSSSEDQTVRIWDMETGQHKTLSSTVDVGAVASSVAISPDGSLVATGSPDSIVRLWNIHTGPRQREPGRDGEALGFEPALKECAESGAVKAAV